MPAGHRTVILSDSASGGARIRRALQASANATVVDAIPVGPDTLRLLRSLEPDIVIVDGAWGTKADVEFIRSVATVLPAALIMLVALDEDMAYVQQALLSGARGFVTQSSAESALAGALDRMLQLETSRRPRPAPEEPSRVVTEGKQGRLITIFSAKGGVGCTVIAVNLAIALHKQTGEPVCLFDCDLHFGNAAVLLNLWPQATLGELLPYADDLTAELVEDAMLTHPSGVRVLLPPATFEDAEKVGPSLVARVVEILRQRHQFVVVDVGGRLDSSTLAILDSSRLLQLTEDLGYPRDKVVIVGNRFSAGWGIRTSDVIETLGHPVSVTLPSDGRLVTQAANRGVPFIIDAPRSAPARAVSELAELIVEADHATDSPETSPRSWWQGR
jgi:pilus assembly protein CpaE